jgi:hypothetical protein
VGDDAWLGFAKLDPRSRYRTDIVGWEEGPTGPSALAMLVPADVARRLAVHENWVYGHADQLGAIRLGDGEKARLRFDLERVARAIGATGAETPPGDRSQERTKNSI